MTETTKTPAVYAAIARVQAELAKDGIKKSRKNDQQNYRFRGIDDIYNAMATPMAEAGLLMLPRVLAREVAERTSSKGNQLFYVVVDVEYDFVAASDGSKHTVRVVGEAMDSADKATNKAMSAAQKYAVLQTFCVPTEGEHDSEVTTHEVVPRQPPPPKPPSGMSLTAAAHQEANKELVARIKELAFAPKPRGLAWDPNHGRHWLKKLWNVLSLDALSLEQQQAAEALLEARLRSEEEYDGLLRSYAETGEVRKEALAG